MTKIMVATKSNQELKEIYEYDFNRWLEITIQLLREEKFTTLDLDNLIEEIKAMGINQKRELKSRLRVLIMHLLKYKYQPEKKSRSWLSTIIEQRRQLEDLLEYNPSLKPYLLEILDRCYQDARKDGSKETGLPITKFSVENIFTVEEILNSDFFPDN